MNPRELIILLLGLAIVAVVLRGLYVALQARRGQIRLAIDKNIPKDVDLDALEMAELPGGGARVVRRGQDSHAANADVERAARRAEALDLGDAADDAVPVLMDAVTVSNPHAHAGNSDSATDDFDDDFDDGAAANAVPEQDYLDDEDGDDEPAGYQADEDPDDVLFDYDDDDAEGMAAVAPDYDERDAGEEYEDYEERGWDSREEADDEDDLRAVGDDDWDDDNDYDADDDEDSLGDEADDDDFDDDYADDDADIDEDKRAEPALGAGNFEEELDSFSMTAGERIGYEGKPGVARQTSLFDDADAEQEAEPAPKRKSLFAAFSRKKAGSGKKANRQPEVAEQVPEKAAEKIPEPPAPARPHLQEAPAPEPHVETFPEEPVMAPEATAEPESRMPSEPSEVLVINVMAREGRQFAGDDLMQTLITAGLKFGDMNIFHQRLGNDSKGPVIFSVANILNPGTFDLNAMDSFSTVGVSMFLALPTPINNLEAFELMMKVATRIRDDLDGELKDDNRNGMTAQTIEHYRQRVRDFELRQLKAAGSRG